MEIFEQRAQVKLLSVPYKAMAQATAALASGEIDILVNDVSTVAPYYQSGRLRPLGATGTSRLIALPDVPTIRDQGVPQYEFTAWSAMFVPAKTPTAIAEKLGAIFHQAQQSKYVTEILHANSQDPLVMNSAQLASMNRAEIERWTKIFADLKIQR